VYSIVDTVNLDEGYLEIREERIAYFTTRNGKMGYKVVGYVIVRVKILEQSSLSLTRAIKEFWHDGKFVPCSHSRGELFDTLEEARETATWLALGEAA
jgi:hypothetical protein